MPDGDGQITSDHGFDFIADHVRLQPLVADFKAIGCRVSLFADAGCAGLPNVARLGTDRIELYTGPYAEGFAAGTPDAALDACVATAQEAQALGLGVNAGHDLSQHNLGLFAQRVPALLEVSIGHALIGEALYAGLHDTVRAYLRVLEGAQQR